MLATHLGTTLNKTFVGLSVSHSVKWDVFSLCWIMDLKSITHDKVWVFLHRKEVCKLKHVSISDVHDDSTTVSR